MKMFNYGWKGPAYKGSEGKDRTAGYQIMKRFQGNTVLSIFFEKNLDFFSIWMWLNEKKSIRP